MSQKRSTLVSHLPDGFTFSYGGVAYRWRPWSLPNGMPKNVNRTVLMGVQIQSSDKLRIAAIENPYQGQQAYGTAKQVTLVIG